MNGFKWICLHILICSLAQNGYAEKTNELVQTNTTNQTSTINETIIAAPTIARGVFLVEHENGSGSGFIMQDQETSYFVSNIHVMSGGEEFSIRNVYGETITIPENVEVAQDRDLVRFPTDSFEIGFPYSSEFDFGDPVFAFGNSGGGGVITKLEGEILAIGPGLLEVSSTIISGNSGGPIMTPIPINIEVISSMI
jgi:S1-C subfamily serine protease